MALGDQAGKIAVDEINSTTLPHVAQIVNDTLTQVAVITNGLLNGIEGERQLAMAALAPELKPLLDPLVTEWSRTNASLEKIVAFLGRISLDKAA